jgi:hypothetical protein
MSTQLTFPKISYTLRAETALTHCERGLLGDYFIEVKSLWPKVHSRVTKIVVDLFVDVEEDIRSIVVTYHLDAEADEALGYWDMIGNELDRWASGAEAIKASEVLNLVSTNVQWRD